MPDPDGHLDGHLTFQSRHLTYCPCITRIMNRSQCELLGFFPSLPSPPFLPQPLPGWQSQEMRLTLESSFHSPMSTQALRGKKCFGDNKWLFRD